MQCCLVTQLTHTIFICFQGNQAKKLTKGQILMQKAQKSFINSLHTPSKQLLKRQPEKPIQCPCKELMLVPHTCHKYFTKWNNIDVAPSTVPNLLSNNHKSNSAILNTMLASHIVPQLQSHPSKSHPSSPSIGNSLTHTLILINTQEIPVSLGPCNLFF